MVSVELSVYPLRVDGLCEQCWTASLWEFDIYALGAKGVTVIATSTYCSQCGAQEKLPW